jgi:hypothetical protein
MFRSATGYLISAAFIGLSAGGSNAEDRKIVSTFTFHPAQGLPTSRQTGQAVSVLVYLLQRIWLSEYTGYQVSLPNFKYCAASEIANMLLDDKPSRGFWAPKCGPVKSLGVRGNERDGYSLEIALLSLTDLDKVVAGFAEVLTSNDLGKYKLDAKDNTDFKEFLAQTHGSNMRLLRNPLDLEGIFDVSEASASVISHRRALSVFRSASAAVFDMKVIRRDKLTTLAINIPAELMN